MNELPFWKMHGAGNDFVVHDATEDATRSDEAWAALAERVCDRHFGVGADGLIAVLPSDVADRRMRIFNPDGSEPEMCGNGIRCLVKFALDQDEALRSRGALRVETLAGVLDAVATFGADGDGRSRARQHGRSALRAGRDRRARRAGAAGARPAPRGGRRASTASRSSRWATRTP